MFAKKLAIGENLSKIALIYSALIF
jgi:hypothetical protein